MQVFNTMVNIHLKHSLVHRPATHGKMQTLIIRPICNINRRLYLMLSLDRRCSTHLLQLLSLDQTLSFEANLHPNPAYNSKLITILGCICQPSTIFNIYLNLNLNINLNLSLSYNPISRIKSILVLRTHFSLPFKLGS
ncbi:unnamed protein product [Clonostachys rosea]|uniref:Uncharacterized protein n=1 Tax=Bionectria ochroleuca TaxID=29856 RepID=A0ABY6UI29_BIOOC|nr:unnamed protein product [Clonostachys rosea]